MCSFFLLAAALLLVVASGATLSEKQLVSLSPQLYVVGGYSGNFSEFPPERFDGNTWTTGPSTKTLVQGGVVVFNKMLYYVGGADRDLELATNAVTCFDGARYASMHNTKC